MAKKNNYIEIVKANVSNVKKGQIFKNEKELFSALGIETIGRGNDLLSVRKTIKVYLDYSLIEEEKRAVKINKKYNKPRMENARQKGFVFDGIEDIVIHSLSILEESEPLWITSKPKNIKCLWIV